MEGNSIKSFENLCKIFEMRIRLDHEKDIDTPKDVILNFEKYTKKIDAFYNNQFEHDIRKYITPGFTIEEEQTRLKKLIQILEERLNKRNELENNFYTATGKYIKGLQLVVSDAELKEKKERLELITKYLDAKEEKEDIIDSIAKFKANLSEEELKKEEYINKNRILEDELYTSFINNINDLEEFEGINEENLDSKLSEIIDMTEDTKETLDITKDSINSLISNGMEEDYNSYIEDAEKNYYNCKNKEIILQIYKLVINFEEKFNDIYVKRENIKDLLDEKKLLMEEINISSDNGLSSFEKVLQQQIVTLNNEKEILENINNLTSRINFKENRLKQLEEVTEKVEIMAILREYGLIETYENNDNTLEKDFELSDIEDSLKIPSLDEDSTLTKEDNIVKEVYDPYRIVEVRDYPKTLNVGLAKLKGEGVREKVNRKLNPKENLPKEEIDSKKEDVSIDSKLPTWEPVINEEDKKENEEVINNLDTNIPVWDIKEENIESKNDIENAGNNIEEIKQEKDIVPMWEEVKPVEATASLENNNSFWTPVSDSKLEASSFPDIDLSIQNKFSSENDNFGFPNINE